MIRSIVEVLIKDAYNEPGSVVIVRGNKASFHTEQGFITRSVKNNKVQVDNVWYRLESHLVHKL